MKPKKRNNDLWPAKSDDPNIEQIQKNVVPKSQWGKQEIDPAQGYGNKLNMETRYNRFSMRPDEYARAYKKSLKKKKNG